MRIARRLFVIPLANNNHGKSTIIRSLVSQGLGQKIQRHKKGVRSLVSPWGRGIDSYVFGRSYQEKERGIYKTVQGALDGNDPDWRKRELVIMPSHVAPVDHKDILSMIDLGHSAGFDVIAASVIFITNDGDNRPDLAKIWPMGWDERWTIPNPWSNSPEGQLEALGRDLWVRICETLAS